MIKKMWANADDIDDILGNKNNEFIEVQISTHLDTGEMSDISRTKQITITDEDLFANVRQVIKDNVYIKNIHSVKSEVGQWLGEQLYDAIQKDIANLDNGK